MPMKSEHRRRAILQEMSRIDRMEKGRLTEEYRDSLQEGAPRRLGPYYKHQCWEEGRNQSRRVPAREVEALREAVEGHQRFVALADEYVELTVAMTREAGPDAKKKPRSQPRPS